MTEGEREAIGGKFSDDDSIAELSKVQHLRNWDNGALELPRRNGKSRSLCGRSYGEEFVISTTGSLSLSVGTSEYSSDLGRVRSDLCSG